MLRLDLVQNPYSAYQEHQVRTLKFKLDIEIIEHWQRGVTDQLLIGIVNMHATSLFTVSVEYMRPRPWEIPEKYYVNTGIGLLVFEPP